MKRKVEFFNWVLKSQLQNQHKQKTESQRESEREKGRNTIGKTKKYSNRKCLKREKGNAIALKYGKKAL